MKVSRQKLVEVLSAEIMKNVSRQVREIVREEVDIERKRLRRQILEEIRETIPSNGNGNGSFKKMIPSRRPFENVVPQRALTPKVKPMNLTGTPEIDNILNEIKVDLEEENQIRDMGDGFGSPIVAKEETDVMNFDPVRDDPTQMDWSAMVEAVDQRAKEKRQSGAIALPQ